MFTFTKIWHGLWWLSQPCWYCSQENVACHSDPKLHFLIWSCIFTILYASCDWIGFDASPISCPWHRYSMSPSSAHLPALLWGSNPRPHWFCRQLRAKSFSRKLAVTEGDATWWWRYATWWWGWHTRPGHSWETQHTWDCWVPFWSSCHYISSLFSYSMSNSDALGQS